MLVFAGSGSKPARGRGGEGPCNSGIWLKAVSRKLGESSFRLSGWRWARRTDTVGGVKDYAPMSQRFVESMMVMGRNGTHSTDD